MRGDSARTEVGRWAAFALAAALLQTTVLAQPVPAAAPDAVALLAPARVFIGTEDVAHAGWVVLVRGSRESDRAQRWTSVMKAIALLVLIVACFSWRALHRMPATVAVAPLAIPGFEGGSNSIW